MATDTKTTINALLKDFYRGPAQSAINTAHPLLEMIETKGAESFSGKKVVFPVSVARGVGVGSRGDDGTLVTASSDTDVEANVEAKYIDARFAITGAAIAAGSGSKNAFVDVVKRKMDTTIENCKDAVLRQLHGYSDADTGGSVAGILTRTAATGNAQTTIQVDSTRFIKVGMTVAIGTSADLLAGAADYRTVVTVPTSTTFTCASVDIVTNDIVCTATASAAAADVGYGNEMSGLANIVSTGDAIQGISGATYELWNGVVSSNSGVNRPLSLNLMGKVYDDISDSSGLEPDFLLCHNSVKREYIDLLVGDVRYVPLNLKGGHTALSFSHGSKEIPLTSDKYAAYNSMYFLNTKQLKLFKLQDWSWMDKDGAAISRIANKDGYEGTFQLKANLSCLTRNCHGVLKDITATL